MSGCFRNSIEEGRTSERPRTIMYKENLSACNLNTAGDRSPVGEGRPLRPFP